MYHSSLVNQVNNKAVQSDQRSSTSKCSNMSKCSSSIKGDRNISDVQSINRQKENKQIKSKVFKPLKTKRVNNHKYFGKIPKHDNFCMKIQVHTEIVQDYMRNIYENYNTGRIDEVQLKNELKHKLYIKLNENELDYKIKNNELNYKQLVNICEKDYKNHDQKITHNEQYFYKPDEQKVQNSKNLWQYRRQQENQNGMLKIEDHESKKLQDYNEYLRKYQSPARDAALNSIDQYSKGQKNKEDFLKDLNDYKLNVQDVKDVQVKSVVNGESTFLKNKVLKQMKEEELANVRYSPAKIPKQFIEHTQPIFKAFNEIEYVNKQDKQKDMNSNDNAIYSSSGCVKMKSLGAGECYYTSRDNGNIITWHSTEEDKDNYARQKQQDLLKNRIKKMKSCEFLYSGLEQINSQVVPAVNKLQVQNDFLTRKQNTDNSINQNYETLSQLYKSARKLDKSVLNDIKKQQQRCFEYDDYITPITIRYTNDSRNLKQNQNIITWQ